jgi:hypothetical protein
MKRKQIRQVANSVKTFGFKVPVLIDRDDKVIAGHCRLLACQELGGTEVPTLRRWQGLMGGRRTGISKSSPPS